jgi:tripartite-type tricarboxylate transporter receptor subunit TctC
VQARILAGEFARRLGQNVLVDNRPGAGTAIGQPTRALESRWLYLAAELCVDFTLNPAINRALPYDPIKSFQPIGIRSAAWVS